MATKRRFNFNRIKIFIIVGVLFYAGVTFYNQQTLLVDQAEKQKELLTIEEELKNKIEFYKNELNYIGSAEYIEKQARERLGWLKEDETKYVEAPDGVEVEEPTASVDPTPTQDVQPTAQMGGAEGGATAEPTSEATKTPEETPKTTE